jgi:hypothetical protein
MKYHIMCCPCGYVPYLREAPFFKDKTRMSMWVVSCRKHDCYHVHGNSFTDVDAAYHNAIEKWNAKMTEVSQ